MDFGLIEREDKEIDMDEWLSFIQKTDYLETMESKEGINPFAGEKVMFHREQKQINYKIAPHKGVTCTSGQMILSILERDQRWG